MKKIKKMRSGELLTTDIKLINSYLLILIVLVTISVTSIGTYAIFTYDRKSTNLIKMVYQPPKPPSLLANEILGEDNSNVVTSGYGLYMSTETNDGSSTYYYQGEVNNNYVSFAGETWRVVRINEDGTIRIIMEEGINDNATYQFHPTATTLKNMYYSETNVTGGAMKTLNDWYNNNLSSYDSLIATSTYCEQLSIIDCVGGTCTFDVSFSFRCEEDENGYGLITNQKIGLININEFSMSASYKDYDLVSETYLPKSKYWTMTPMGIPFGRAYGVIAISYDDSYLKGLGDFINVSNLLYPVINLKSDVTVKGTGANDDMWIIQ